MDLKKYLMFSDKNQLFGKHTQRDGNGSVTVPFPLCYRSATVAATVAVTVGFTEGVKFRLFCTHMTSDMPQKQNRSAALKMAFLQLFVFPNFPHFSESNLSTETCMDGK